MPKTSRSDLRRVALVLVLVSAGCAAAESLALSGPASVPKPQLDLSMNWNMAPLSEQ